MANASPDSTIIGVGFKSRSEGDFWGRKERLLPEAVPFILILRYNLSSDNFCFVPPG
jgi:hypothetical protein